MRVAFAVVVSVVLTFGMLGAMGSKPTLAETTLPFCAESSGYTTCNFTPGEEHTFVVPAGLTRLGVVAMGGAGGDADYGCIDALTPSDQVGCGALVRATLDVQPGETLYIEPGGGPSTGWNGGGATGTIDFGGGASTIQTCSRTTTACASRYGTLSDPRLVVAGGGGGSGFIESGDGFSFPNDGRGGNAARGSGLAGSNGNPSTICSATGGRGATATAAGTGGVVTGSSGHEANGGRGTAVRGGAGANTGYAFGGGGGGGFYSGGGGAAASPDGAGSGCASGGGAGSSYAAPRVTFGVSYARADEYSYVAYGSHLGEGIVSLTFRTCSTGLNIYSLVVACTHFPTGQEQSVTIPSDVSTLYVVAKGAQGAATPLRPANVGGEGAEIHAAIPVHGGERLYLTAGVPGAGTGGGGFQLAGYNGGGGGTIFGGGATTLQTCSSSTRACTALLGTAHDPRVVVAGGGGGAGEYYSPDDTAGGRGGNALLPGHGLSGVAGRAGACPSGVHSPGGGGAGGTATTGGAAGTSPDAAHPARPGTAGKGGNGSLDPFGGGGGGGGYFGGGGGGGSDSCAGGGGGGGSSFVEHSATGVSSALDATGHPLMALTYIVPPFIDLHIVTQSGVTIMQWHARSEMSGQFIGYQVFDGKTLLTPHPLFNQNGSYELKVKGTVKNPHIVPVLPTSPSLVPATCSKGGGYTDPFDGSFSKSWSTRIPQSGPTFSLTNDPDCLSLNVPESAVYDSSNNADNAPELLRAAPASTAWTATSRVSLSQVGKGSGGFHTGLVLRLPNATSQNLPDQYFWGLYRSGASSPLQLRLEESGVNNLVSLPLPPKTVDLRIHFDPKSKCQYTFSYRVPPDTAFHDTGYNASSCQTPLGVGLFTKTFGSPLDVTTDFDWFNLLAS